MNPIRRLRAERGWTQQALAWRAGLDQKTVSRIERNAGDHSRATLTCLAYAFGMRREVLEAMLLKAAA